MAGPGLSLAGWQPDPPPIRAIQAAVCHRFGVTLQEMLSPRRTAHLVRARHAAFWLARAAGCTFPEIGRAFGDRDHTTVMHAGAADAGT